MTKFNPGDQVMIDPDVAGKWAGQVLTVERYLSRNVDLKTAEGGRLRAPAEYLVAASPELIAAAEATPVEAILWPGTVVTAKNRPGLWVVLAQNASGRYRLARLGGDDGRYVTNATRSNLTEVDVSEAESLFGNS